MQLQPTHTLCIFLTLLSLSLSLYIHIHPQCFQFTSVKGSVNFSIFPKLPLYELPNQMLPLSSLPSAILFYNSTSTQAHYYSPNLIQNNKLGAYIEIGFYETSTFSISSFYFLFYYYLIYFIFKSLKGEKKRWAFSSFEKDYWGVMPLLQNDTNPWIITIIK